MTDKRVVQQVLGGLMARPSYLVASDKYNLTPQDFPDKWTRKIFRSIYILYTNGASVIRPIDIENLFNQDPSNKRFFEQSNGIEYLQDLQELAEVENFDFYYNQLKKINLLNDLKKDGIDISDFYIEDLLNPKANEVNRNFDALTVSDIIMSIKSKILHLENNYAQGEQVQIEDVSEGLDELIEGFGTTDSLGLPLQGNIYSTIIGGAVPGTLTIRSGSSGLGKALPNSIKIPTPIGWRQVGEIKEGDYLFDAFGKPTKVLGVYPQGIKEVYQVTFKDGRTARCCDEHLWSYNTYSQKESAKTQRKFYTKTLKEIAKEPLQDNYGAYRILVPMQKAVEYEEKNHYLPSYIMGLLLGDGSFRQHPSNKALQFSSEDSELPEAIGNTMNWFIKKNLADNYTWYFSTKENQDKAHEKINVWVEDALKEHLDLINTDSKSKFIPREYIEDSIENRYDLLSGLLDSDGHVDDKGRISYYTISEQLRDDFTEVAKSLGFKTHILIDEHKETNIGYVISIQGRPEDKIKLFKLKRKKAIIEKWYNNTSRFEKNTHNPIVKIEKLNYSEAMTCFYVDNEEHLFLTEDFIVTHNTRTSVMDMCYLSLPVRYNSQTQEWMQIGYSEKSLYIVTEQTKAEIQRMILAYLTDINEDKFKYGLLTEEEKRLVRQAQQILTIYKENIIIVRMPGPTIGLIKSTVREQCILHDINYVFYDYIFIGPELLGEYKGFNLRNDEILLMVSTALKDLAVELNVAMFTATQVNAKSDDNRDIKNEAALAGSRSIINKADNGAIMSRPTRDEIELLSPFIQKYGEPNLVTDIYKVRSGRWTQVRIWSRINLGTLKKEDLFLTNSRLELVEDFDIIEYEISDWDNEEIITLVKELNNELSGNH